MSEPEGTSIIGIEPEAGSIVLTYDDGPTPGVTDRILAALGDAGATATFFVLLTRVRRSPELLRDLLAAGHEVGLHGRDHRRLTTLDPALVPGLIRDGRRELEDAVGGPVRWFRPPYGAQDAATWHAVRAAGLTPVLWSLHCRDWEDVSAEDRLRELRSGPMAGHVILLHDGFADASDGVDDGPEPVFDRLALTVDILEEARRHDVRARSLGAALESSSAVVGPWFDAG